LRLPKPPPDFSPDNWKTDWETFNPSGADEKHAAASGRAVRVSVWEQERTTPEQARAFRATASIVLRVAVAAVVQTSEMTQRPLDVVYEPLEAPDGDLPGADGHAGIEGLKRAAGEQKTKWKAALQALADCSELLSD
jgi:hypothetical protein